MRRREREVISDLDDSQSNVIDVVGNRSFQGSSNNVNPITFPNDNSGPLLGSLDESGKRNISNGGDGRGGRNRSLISLELILKVDFLLICDESLNISLKRCRCGNTCNATNRNRSTIKSGGSWGGNTNGIS